MANQSLLGSFGDSSGSSLMFRNKIINGNFDIWQRNTTQTTTGYGSADRWKFDVLTNVTASRQTASSPYGTFNMLLTPSNATNSFIMAQTLESTQISDLRSKQVTVSFQASAASGTQIITLNLQKSATANDSTGGGGGWTTISAVNCSVTSTIQTFTLTGIVPNDGTANGLRIAFVGTNTTNGVGIAIWGVQMELGSVATPFEVRPVGMELALCQRYYYRWQSTGAGARYAFGSYNNSAPGGQLLSFFPVVMRAAPGIIDTTGSTGDYSLAIGAGSAALTALPSISVATTTNVMILAPTASGASIDGYAATLRAANATAFIGLSAEIL